MLENMNNTIWISIGVAGAITSILFIFSNDWSFGGFAMKGIIVLIVSVIWISIGISKLSKV